MFEPIQFGNKNLEDVITSFPKETYHEEMNTMDRAGSIGGELLKKLTVVFDYLNYTFNLTVKITCCTNCGCGITKNV